jgi:hypothetical protein
MSRASSPVSTFRSGTWAFAISSMNGRASRTDPNAFEAMAGPRCRQSRSRRLSLQLFASSLSQHCAPAVSSCAIALTCKWLDECELNPLIDVATLHEDVIPSFQMAQYHQSSEFDTATTGMNISDRGANISAAKLGWTSC